MPVRLPEPDQLLRVGQRAPDQLARSVEDAGDGEVLPRRQRGSRSGQASVWVLSSEFHRGARRGGRRPARTTSTGQPVSGQLKRAAALEPRPQLRIGHEVPGRARSSTLTRWSTADPLSRNKRSPAWTDRLPQLVDGPESPAGRIRRCPEGSAAFATPSILDRKSFHHRLVTQHAVRVVRARELARRGRPVDGDSPDVRRRYAEDCSSWNSDASRRRTSRCLVRRAQAASRTDGPDGDRTIVLAVELQSGLTISRRVERALAVANAGSAPRFCAALEAEGELGVLGHHFRGPGGVEDHLRVDAETPGRSPTNSFICSETWGPIGQAGVVRVKVT